MRAREPLAFAPRRRGFGPAASSAAWRVAGGYLLLAVLAAALVLAVRDGMPWTHPAPWLALGGVGGAVTSAAMGVSLAMAVVLLTRVLVARFAWARRLHGELRPVARELSTGHVLLVAGLSSLGEELVFRGLFTPMLGVVASAVLFGLAHQIKGPSRWVWVVWATLVGLGLGAIFALTGSLVGPIVAHAIVNAVNLAFLRGYDPDADEARAPRGGVA
jgi:membrane protease YdiL (CAAX protease family)